MQIGGLVNTIFKAFAAGVFLITPLVCPEFLRLDVAVGWVVPVSAKSTDYTVFIIGMAVHLSCAVF